MHQDAVWKVIPAENLNKVPIEALGVDGEFAEAGDVVPAGAIVVLANSAHDPRGRPLLGWSGGVGGDGGQVHVGPRRGHGGIDGLAGFVDLVRVEARPRAEAARVDGFPLDVDPAPGAQRPAENVAERGEKAFQSQRHEGVALVHAGLEEAKLDGWRRSRRAKVDLLDGHECPDIRERFEEALCVKVKGKDEGRRREPGEAIGKCRKGLVTETVERFEGKGESALADGARRVPIGETTDLGRRVGIRNAKTAEAKSDDSPSRELQREDGESRGGLGSCEEGKRGVALECARAGKGVGRGDEKGGGLALDILERRP